MKVLKSTIHKLEVERPCGCKIAGDYEDAAYKVKRGTSVFASCEVHREAAALVEDLLKEVLEKEAAEAKAPEVILPRVQTAVDQGIASAQPQPVVTNGTVAAGAQASTSAGSPVRTLRTQGSSGSAGREQQNRNGYGSPAIGRGTGTHRPAPKVSGASPFKRSDSGPATTSAGIQSHQAKVASSLASMLPGSSSGIDIDFDVQEDPRITNAVEILDLLGEDPTDFTNG
jgi:hypothetical protein